jgi:hypothetical protein
MRYPPTKLFACLALGVTAISTTIAPRSDRKCSDSGCVTYGGPNTSYATTAAARTEHGGGWIVGEIRAFAFGADNAQLVASLAANGWVECAGQLIENQDFPEAVAVLQGTWGSKDESKRQVYLPDLRGLILRGWQHERQVPARYPFSPYLGDSDLGNRVFPRPELLDLEEPGIAGPTDPRTKKLLKNHVGSMQAEQFHGHRHALSATAGNGSVAVATDPRSSTRASGEPVKVGGATIFEGGTETHPPNAYVMYMIYLGRSASEVGALAGDQSPVSSRHIIALKN